MNGTTEFHLQNSDKSLQAEEIAQALRGTLEGNGAVEIDGAAGLLEATERHIAFFSNPKYIEQLEKTRAGVVVIPEKTDGLKLPPGKTLIRVPNPPLAFAKILGIFERQLHRPPAQGVDRQASVHSSAELGKNIAIGPFTVVEEGAQIGEGTVIYSGCYIGARVKIGDNCLIYPNVVLRENTQLGSNVIIQPGAVLGSDGYGFATHQGKHHKIPQIGTVIVGNDVEIGANSTIDRATTGETRIGEGTKIDNLVHIAHNVQIGKHCLIVALVGISGSTKIGNNVTLAGQVGVTGHVSIGDNSVIAAQSGIMNNVEPGSLMFGSPARPHRDEMRIQALLGRLPDMYDTIKTLKKKFLP